MEEIWKVYRDTRIAKNGNYMKKAGKLYELSNYGRIRINGVITEPKKFRNTEYYACPASKYSGLLHRNIAKLFIDNPENKPCVDHIDGNKHNNRVDNLRWVTHKENNNNPVTKTRFLESLHTFYSNPLYVCPFKGKHHSEESKRKLSKAHKGKKRSTPIWNKGLKNCYSEETIRKMQESIKITKSKWSEEKRNEINNKIRNKVKGNSNVKGYVHIHNGKVHKMIPKDELNNYISNGWTKGRINIHKRYNTDTAGIDEILSIDTNRNNYCQ